MTRIGSSVAFLVSLIFIMGDPFKIALHSIDETLGNVLGQRWLIVFDRQTIVAVSRDDLRGDILLAAHGVNRDDRTLQGQSGQKFWDGGDLIGFAIDRAL